MTNVLFSLALALVMMALQTSGFPGTPPWAIAMYVPLVGAAAMIYLECRQPRRRPMARERSIPIPPKPTSCYWDGCYLRATRTIRELSCVAGFPFSDDRAYCGEHARLAEQRKDPTP